MPAPTQPTFLSLQQDVLNRIGENVNSPVAQLPSGTGGAPTFDTLFAVRRYLNEGKNILAGECYPVFEDAGFTYPVGAKSYPYPLLATADGASVKGVYAVAVGGINLPFVSRERAFVNAVATAVGTPAYFSRVGSGSLALYPLPSAATVATASAIVIPPDMVADTDVAAWLRPDLARLLVFYAAFMVATIGIDDKALGPRAAGWEKEWEEGKARLLVMLKESDPSMAALFFGVGDPTRSK